MTSCTLETSNGSFIRWGNNVVENQMTYIFGAIWLQCFFHIFGKLDKKSSIVGRVPLTYYKTMVDVVEERS